MVLIAGFVIPPYTGAIVMYTGVAIGLGNAVGLIALVLLPAIGFIKRIPKEEALLGEVLALAAPSTPDRRAVSFLVSGEPESHASREGVSVAHQDVRAAADSRLMA